VVVVRSIFWSMSIRNRKTSWYLLGEGKIQGN
jgi:hypothetical protein